MHTQQLRVHKAHLGLEEPQQLHAFREQVVPFAVQAALERILRDARHDVLLDAVARADEALVRLVLELGPHQELVLRLVEELPAPLVQLVRTIEVVAQLQRGEMMGRGVRM